jgi:MFS family permease
MSEVAELYVSRMLRMAAVFMAASFMSIFLYQLGYSIAILGFCWAAFFIFKTIIALPLARIIAWIGPKHAILISNLLYIPAMVSFALLPEFPEWDMLLIPLVLFFQAVSAAMYSIAYLIDFSKVKHSDHAGKEIAYMNIFEKVTTGLSPLIGGFIAFLWGQQVVLIVAGILFAFAAAPLLSTGEQVRVNQKLQFRGFPYRMLFRHMGAQFAVGFDSFTSGTVWTLYLAIAVLVITENGNSAYATMGILLSVVFFVAIVASYTYGRIIDKSRGGDLMKAAAVASAITHIVRPFTTTPIGAAGINAAHELGATGYSLPYTRAVFDNADRSGMRTTYLGLNEVFSNLGAGIAALIFGGIALLLPEEIALKAFFFIGAGVVLLILTARFPLYKK